MWKIKTTRQVFKKRHSHKSMYDIIFGLSMAVGVTPKKLAKFLNNKKILRFAEEFSKEIKNKDQKERQKLLDKMNKK